MRVDRIEVRHVSLPLVYPFRTAFGEVSATGSILVRIVAGGRDAWGEATPFAVPTYSPEWAGGAFRTIERCLAPALVGREVASAGELQRLLGHFKGNQFAKAALDTAWWALAGLEAGRPLHRLLGGERERVEIGADLGVLDSLEELIGEIGAAVDAGYRRVKLKFRPGWDLDMLAAVRSTFPTLTVHIDCNSAYSLDDLPLFRQVEAFEPAMIEQPLGHDDLLDHAKLQAQLQTPICLDESASSVQRVRQAIELGSCRYVNVKPGRVGGLTNAVAIHDLCREADIPCWVGGMLESRVGAAGCVALATLDNFRYPADIFPTERFYGEDLSGPSIEFERGEDGGVFAVAADLPGIAQAPIEARLEECTVEHAVIEAT